jgi:hypothetical protein
MAKPTKRPVRKPAAAKPSAGKGGVDHAAPGVIAVSKGFDACIAAAKEHKIRARDGWVNPPR